MTRSLLQSRSQEKIERLANGDINIACFFEIKTDKIKTIDKLLRQCTVVPEQ